MFAIGRKPNFAGLGLENLELTFTEGGRIAVDDHCRTSVSNVFAVGDIANGFGLTPVALHEGTVVANCLYNDTALHTEYGFIPTAVFSHPEVGTVGLTEELARREYKQIDVYVSRFRPLKHTLSANQEKTMMKLIVDRRSDKVLGFHAVGADVAEMTQGVAVALKCGATKAQFDATIGIHPTSAEEFVTMRTPRRDPNEP
jgi:glutathione reductase (NADPH)